MSCIYLSWLISHLLQVPWSNRDGGVAALKNNRLTYLLIFFGLLSTEIVIALFVNDAFIRPYVGDMLVTLLICCLCRLIIPANVSLLPVYVFIFAAVVEIGQYFDLVALLGLTDNRIISIALGRTFSWMDLVCYAVGCVAAFLVDKIIIRRSKT